MNISGSDGGTSMHVIINDVWCKNCGICATVCTKKVFSYDFLAGSKVENEGECIDCKQCVLMCPDFAITVVNKMEARQ